MTSHYYRLIGAIQEVAELVASDSTNPYHGRAEITELQGRCEELRTQARAILHPVVAALEAAAQLFYEQAGVPVFQLPSGEWKFPDATPSLGKAIREALEQLPANTGISWNEALGYDLGSRLKEIMRSMRPQHPLGGDDPSIRPCWPSCLVSSSSSS